MPRFGFQMRGGQLESGHPGSPADGQVCPAFQEAAGRKLRGAVWLPGGAGGWQTALSRVLGCVCQSKPL